MAATRNGEGTDRLAIAEQVIVSAGNILVAAGFTRAEIRSFFQQAADQLEQPAPSAAGDDPLRAAFAASSAVRKLAELEPRVHALPAAGVPGVPLRDHFDIAMQMIPLVAEAQDWLRRAASEAGLPIHADRQVASATGQAAAGALYYEDFTDQLGFAFDHLRTLCQQLAAQDDGEALAFLLAFLTDNGVIITRDLADAIRRGTGLMPS